MYGGGFATVPAYLADMFGTKFVGAIHGRLLTAWSTAGIVGPVVVNYIREFNKAAGVPTEKLYEVTTYILACMLAVGFICNALVKPVADKWFIKEDDKGMAPAQPMAASMGSDFGIDRGHFDTKAILAWTLVGIPVAWGVWKTLESAVKLFQ